MKISFEAIDTESYNERVKFIKTNGDLDKISIKFQEFMKYEY